MTTSSSDPNTPDECVPQCVSDCVSEPARAPGETSASPSPLSYEGDALSEPSRDALTSASKTPDAHPKPDPGMSTSARWLLTPRSRPAWIALLDLLDDDQWHPSTDVHQVMRNTADLADQTIRKHLASASRRGWITTRRGRTRLRNRDLIEAALATSDEGVEPHVSGRSGATPWAAGAELDEAAIRARLEAATEGPWEAMTDPGDRHRAPSHLVEAGDLVLRVEGLFDVHGLRLAEFIAHARTDIPLLLAALTSARTKIERLTEIGVEVTRDHAEARKEVERLTEELRTSIRETTAAEAERDREARARQAAEQERDAHRLAAEILAEEVEARKQERDRARLSRDAAKRAVVRHIRARKAAEGAVERLRALIPNQCWVLRSPASGPTCTDMVGGGTPNGAKFTEDMCCLPCRLRAALDATDTPTDAEPLATEVEAIQPIHDDDCDSWGCTHCEVCGAGVRHGSRCSGHPMPGSSGAVATDTPTDGSEPVLDGPSFGDYWPSAPTDGSER